MDINPWNCPLKWQWSFKKYKNLEPSWILYTKMCAHFTHAHANPMLSENKGIKSHTTHPVIEQKGECGNRQIFYQSLTMRSVTYKNN